MKASTLQALLIEKFNLDHCRTSEDFDGSIGGLWLSGSQLIDGLELFNYYWYDNDPQENLWEMGIYKPFDAYIRECGFFPEPYDSGTLMLYPE